MLDYFLIDQEISDWIQNVSFNFENVIGADHVPGIL